jgi:hypothetical protein
MERRSASHTEEEELNQRRRLLNLARKGDPKAINRLFELYQVRVFTGEAFSRGRLPSWPTVHPKPKPRKKTIARARKRRQVSRTRRRVSARKSARKSR